MAVGERGWAARPWTRRLWFRIASSVALFLALLLSSPAHASGAHPNLGIEGGFSAAHTLSKKGGHVALRGSVVELEWSRTRAHLAVPTDWLGAYGRLEINVQDTRGVIGIGHSVLAGILGLEGGIVFARDRTGRLGGGGELTALLTVGILGLYVRESYVHTEVGRWQTDVGVRLVFPFFPSSY